MRKKVKIVNNSSKVLNEEITYACMHETISEASDVLSAYNLKIHELERIFDKDDNVLETIITIADSN